MNQPMKPDALAGDAPVRPVVAPNAPRVTYPARRVRYRLFAAVGALVLATGLGAYSFWPGGEAVRYSTAAADRGDVTRTVTATGTVNPVLTIIVGTYVSGVIQELHCDYNTRVEVGQVCAKIDPRPYQTVVDQNRANLAQAKAQIEKTKAVLAYAQVVYERNECLAQTNAVPPRTPTA